MAIKTYQQFDPAGTASSSVAVGAVGTKEYVSADGIYGDQWTNQIKDLVAIEQQQLLCGVITGGVVTCPALTVTLPTGTYLYAGVIWTLTTDATTIVSDNSTTYIWFQSNGIITQTGTTTQPGGFLRNQCCLLAKITTVAGVGTVDLSVQDQARTVNATYRTVTELNAVNGFGFTSMPDTFPAGSTVTIPANYTARLIDGFINNGTIINNGRMRVEAF